MDEPEGFEARPMTPFAAVGWTLAITFVWLALASVLASARGAGEADIDLVTDGGCQAAVYLLGLFCILRVHAPEASIRQFVALRKTHVLFYVAAPLMAVTVCAFANVAYGVILGRFPTGHEGVEDALILDASPGKQAALFAIIVIVGPIVEELIFRGAIVQGLRKTTSLPVVAVVSAAAFALAHPQWQAFLPLMLCGGALVILRLASGSLVPGLLMHATYNAVEFVELFRSRAHGDEQVRFRLPLFVLGLVGTAILLLLVRTIANTDAARSARQLDEVV
jgi:membrane protease YdiL (CAAX protease family)